MAAKSQLRLPALEIRQGEGRRLYSFGVDGKMLPNVAAISRIRRADGAEVTGYQRPEVLSHVAEIRNYVESESPMIPNAVVIAFDDRVQFESFEKEPSNGAPYSRAGELVVPLVEGQSDAEKPGWIVDGQQRLAAIRDAKVDSFPICAVAFVAADLAEQREQFILVNSTKPLPKGLIYELLPSTNAVLPSLLRRRRFPAALLARLNHDEDSPLQSMIKTATMGDGVIQDNSILRMLENSLNDGVLYRYRVTDSEGGDIESMIGVLKRFWTAVSKVFPRAWGEPPRRSRLSHGAGIVSLGFLMDAIADRYREADGPTEDQFAEELRVVEPHCRWTEGFWEFGPGSERKWNELQNTSRDVQLLSNYLLVRYRRSSKESSRVARAGGR